MDAATASGWFALAAVLVSSSLYAVNRLAPSISKGYMRFHCLAGFTSVLLTAIHAAYSHRSLVEDWGGLTNLGLVLVIAGSGTLLRYLPDAGSYRFHSSTLHPALTLALLVSLLFHILG